MNKLIELPVLPIPKSEQDIKEIFTLIGLPPDSPTILSYINTLKDRKGHHNLDHVLFMTNLLHTFLNMNNTKFNNLNPLILAILFHDTAYIPGYKRNEIDSVSYFTELFKPYWSVTLEKQIQPIVETLILNSVNPKETPPQNQTEIDTLILHDLDYAILGSDWGAYSTYALGIAYEARTVVDFNTYKQKRFDFLMKTLSKYIFRLEVFRNSFENIARDNIQKEITFFFPNFQFLKNNEKPSPDK